MESELTNAIKDLGFPVVAALGMGYFIYFIWKWVTTVIDPVIGATTGTLIKLVDRVRMLDNDIIRLNTKLSMVLENEAKLDKARRAELEDIVAKYSDTTNDPFDSTGKKDWSTTIANVVHVDISAIETKTAKSVQMMSVLNATAKTVEIKHYVQKETW